VQPKEVSALRVETIIKFRDLKSDKIREPGEQFTVSKERFQELKEHGFVKEVKEEKPETTEEL